MNRLFFSESTRTFEQITGLFDFVWPTAAAMWNLRWQVQGYLSAVPNATVEELRGRFTHGIVLRVIATVDAELARSARAEAIMRSRWLALNGRRYTLKGTRDPGARSRQIARLVYKLQMPRPTSTFELDRWLRATGLVG